MLLYEKLLRVGWECIVNLKKSGPRDGQLDGQIVSDDCTFCSLHWTASLRRKQSRIAYSSPGLFCDTRDGVCTTSIP